MEAYMNKEFNLKGYRPSTSTSFVGRPQGESVRKKLSLEQLDQSDDEVVITIPSDTTSFNPSFFLGLLFNSIEKLGMEKFRSKYKFRIETENPSLRQAISKNIEDGFRHAMNTLRGKDGINVFG